MLSNKFIEYVKENNIDINTIPLVDFVISLYYHEFITENDRLLLDFAFSKNPTQADLDIFLSKWDIEVAGGNKALMLAYVMKMHPNLKFTAYEGPRLDGLLKYYRFKNLKTISHFVKVGKELNRRDGTCMIIKGGLMRYLRPDLPRIMGDVDMYVFNDEDHAKVWDIAIELGYECKIEDRYNRYAVGLHEVGAVNAIVDLHRFIQMDSNLGPVYSDKLLARAFKVSAFSVDVLIPSHEDIMFIILHNLSKNLRDKTSVAGTLYHIFDCQYILSSKPDFNWDIVHETIAMTKNEMQIALATKFINKIVPNLLPADLEESNAGEDELKDFIENILYFRFYVLSIQGHARSLSLLKIFSSFDYFKDYFKTKPKYFVLKRLRNCKPFVKAYLKSQAY